MVFRRTHEDRLANFFQSPLPEESLLQKEFYTTEIYRACIILDRVLFDLRMFLYSMKEDIPKTTRLNPISILALLMDTYPNSKSINSINIKVTEIYPRTPYFFTFSPPQN
jgi:hypothetical protein